MISRRYSRKVRFFEEQEVADGYGGYVSQNVFLFESWAEVVTSAAGNRFQQFGISEFVNPVIFKIRKGNRVITENMYINYKSVNYYIRGIENEDLEDRFLTLYCDGNKRS